MNSWPAHTTTLVSVLAEEETDCIHGSYTSDGLLYLRLKPNNVPEHVRNAALRGDFPLNQENQQMIRKLLHKIDELQSAS